MSTGVKSIKNNRMKTKLTLFKSLILTACCALFSTAGFAQANMEVRISNDAQTSPTVYEFDITLINNGADTLELSGHQYGINYNTAIKNGGNLTASWVAGSSEILSGQLQTTINTISNPSQMRISSLPLVGAGNGTKIAPGTGKRVGRLRMTNSIPFGIAKPNIIFSTVASTSSTRTTHGWYNGTTNTNFCSPSLSTTCSGTATWTYLQTNPTLTPNNCTTPDGSGIVTNVLCAGGSDGAIDLTVNSGGPAPFSYAWSNGATTQDLSGLSAGNYSVIISPDGGICIDTVFFTVNDGAPLTSNTSSASACDSYTWNVDGQTYTASGTYSSVSGCHTEILNLTITPSTSNTTTASVCDTYTWNVDGQTYTASGTYSSVNGCHTEILNLTITPSTSNTTTASACDSYTWSVDGNTYTSSGSYSSVNGCHTEILSLTITPSTSNTTTASVCDSYVWNVDGNTYTASGTYSSVNGCHTEILSLTITPSTSNTTTASVCDSYVWSVDGNTYTASGTYSSVNGCHTEILSLTITLSTSNTTTASACEQYTWNVTGTTYTASGTYSSVTGCHTEILNLTITPAGVLTTTAAACDSYTWSVDGNTYSSTGIYTSINGCTTQLLDLTITNSTSNTTVASVCDSYVWAVNGTTYTASGTYSVVNGCHTEILDLTITISTSNSSTASACDSYEWSVNGTTYTASGTYSSVNGCHTEYLTLTITPSTSQTQTEIACYTYTWNLNSTTYTQSGTYSVVTGCHTDILNLSIIEIPAAPSAISGPAIGCIPGVAGSATFSVPAVTFATNYTWTVPTGFTISSGQGTNSIVVSWTATAVQNGIQGSMCVTASNICGTSPETCTPVEYQITKPVTPGSISGPSKLCPGETGVFSIAAVARATSYSWTLPTGMSISAGAGTNVITVSVLAGYTGGTISVTAANICGVSPVRTRTVTTNLPSTPGTITGTSTGLCNNSSSVFSVGAAAGATSYLWAVSTGGTIISGQGTTTVTVSFGQFTTGSISVQSVNGCATSTARSLTLRGAPAQPGIISGLGTVCVGTQQPYSVSTVSGAASYVWANTFAGSIASGQGTKNILMNWNSIASSQGISVYANNACGNSTTRSKTGISVTACARSFDNEGAFTLTAFPNPASDRVTIVFNAPKDGDYRMSIVDLAGRLMFAQDLDILSGVSQMDLDLSGYAAGMYLVSLENGQEIQNIRLIVE